MLRERRNADSAQVLHMVRTLQLSLSPQVAPVGGPNNYNRSMGTRSRHYEHSVLQDVSEDDVVSSTPSALRDLLAFCSACNSQPTVYTGSTGLSYALWRAGTLLQQSDWCDNAAQVARSALKDVYSRPGYYVRESLLDGTAGVLLVNSLILSQQESPELQELLPAYTSICRTAAQSADSDEFLYGKAGTLFGALLLRHCVSSTAIPDDAVGDLVNSILVSGRSTAARLPPFQQSRCPLAYLWPPGAYSEPYLGAAHGLIGILYVLLHCKQWLQHDPQAMTDIQDSLTYVLSCESDAPGAASGSGGHFPTLMKLQGMDNTDRHVLVHWCHGAPGAVYLFSQAYEVLGDEAYLQAAVRAGQLVWQRGLLKKGPGLCHGVAGNAYALLRVWKATKDPVWLQRATRFAAFLCSATGKADWTIPDNPASLFEGAAGGICLLAELAALHASAGGQCGGGEQAQQAASARQGFVNDAEQHDALLQRSGSIAFPFFELPS